MKDFFLNPPNQSQPQEGIGGFCAKTLANHEIMIIFAFDKTI
jgi:hypothetical protein